MPKEKSNVGFAAKVRDLESNANTLYHEYGKQKKICSEDNATNNDFKKLSEILAQWDEATNQLNELISSRNNFYKD